MTDLTNGQIYRRIIEEVFNKGNLAVIDEIYPETFIEHQFDLPSTAEEFKGTVSYLRHTFAPFSLTIEDLVEDGDMVWCRQTARGTDTGGIMGRPPSGTSFEITVVDICRFADGKLVEHWGVPDRFHQLVQLGALPKPQ